MEVQVLFRPFSFALGKNYLFEDFNVLEFCVGPTKNVGLPQIFLNNF